jgi:hypothetical protein
MVSEDGNCNLILPKQNLITNKDNKTIYFGRMSDELIRYNRIKSFMLQPQVYLSFGSLGYNLRENEIILIQSSLTQEYFENLTPAINNKYVKYNSYDETEPIITQIYDNRVPLTMDGLDQAITLKTNVTCSKTDKKHIASGIWKKCFPDNYGETEYSRTKICTFDLIIDLIELKTGNKISINQIKSQLYIEYRNYLDRYQDKIIEVLIDENREKKPHGNLVISGKMSFENFIFSNNYFLTTFDLWLLVNKFKIPTIFISSFNILETMIDINGEIIYKKQFVGYGDITDKFAFIVLPGRASKNDEEKTMPNFKLIKSHENEVFISLDKLNSACIGEIRGSISEKISVEKFLEDFKKPSKKPTEKAKELIIEEDNEEPVKRKRGRPRKENNIQQDADKINKKENNKTTRKTGGKVGSKNKSRKLVKRN